MRILQQVFRVHTQEEHFERQIRFYESLQGVTCERRLKIRETGVEAAKIGGFLLFGGDKQHIDAIRHVNAIFYVDSLDDSFSWLNVQNVEILYSPRSVTGGRNLTARHADGLVVEYFEAQAPSAKH
jgi:hypothetical protein